VRQVVRRDSLRWMYDTTSGPGNYTSADADAASVAIADYWTALAEDDDAALLATTSAAFHEAIGTTPGMCERSRAATEVSREACGHIGTSSRVRVVNGWMIFVCIELADGEEGREVGTFGPQAVEARLLVPIFERGRWVVHVNYVLPSENWQGDTAYLDLSSAPTPDRPIH